MDKSSVLFVCTGNICRSPTAEAVLRHYIQQNSEFNGILTDSAGTHDYHVGDPPDERAIDIARSIGVDMSDLRARRVNERDFHEFDYIIAMDQGHMRILERLKPKDAKGELVLFMDYVAELDDPDVPDPYYGTLDDFRYVLDLAQKGAKGLLDHICAKSA